MPSPPWMNYVLLKNQLLEEPSIRLLTDEQATNELNAAIKPSILR